MESRELVWEDPPGTNRGRGRRGKWLDALEPLMSRPGEWARILDTPTATHAHNQARNLASRHVAIPPGEWEFTGRRLDDATGAVYARYIGPEDSA